MGSQGVEEAVIRLSCGACAATEQGTVPERETNVMTEVFNWLFNDGSSSKMYDDVADDMSVASLQVIRETLAPA